MHMVFPTKNGVCNHAGRDIRACHAVEQQRSEQLIDFELYTIFVVTLDAYLMRANTIEIDDRRVINVWRTFFIGCEAHKQLAIFKCWIGYGGADIYVSSEKVEAKQNVFG